MTDQNILWQQDGGDLGWFNRSEFCKLSRHELVKACDPKTEAESRFNS